MQSGGSCQSATGRLSRKGRSSREREPAVPERGAPLPKAAEFQRRSYPKPTTSPDTAAPTPTDGNQEKFLRPCPARRPDMRASARHCEEPDRGLATRFAISVREKSRTTGST